jgi:hypothetical protein
VPRSRKRAARPDPIARLRRICLELPEAAEEPFGGHVAPAWRVRGKIFAMSRGEDKPTDVWCKAGAGAQGVLVESNPGLFFVPPYVGSKGWIGMRLSAIGDWNEVADLIRESYRLTAPKKLAAQLAPAESA